MLTYIGGGRAGPGSWSGFGIAARWTVVAGCAVALVACGSTATSTSAPTAAAPTTSPTVATNTYHFPASASFALPLSLAAGPEWDVQTGINMINFIHQGDPSSPNDLWGAGAALVAGALVHDPADVVSDQPASPDKSKFVPWPKDYFGYVTSLAGVKVLQAPQPVTIGGMMGTQMIVHTPAMRPLLWLENDYTWLGGGPRGNDPEAKRLLVLLEVNGEQVLLEFDDGLATFDGHYPLVQQLFSTIAFTA